MSKYRIMVEGEDGTLWCHANNVSESQITQKEKEVSAAYPYAQYWVEDEQPPFWSSEYDEYDDCGASGSYDDQESEIFHYEY